MSISDVTSSNADVTTAIKQSRVKNETDLKEIKREVDNQHEVSSLLEDFIGKGNKIDIMA
jgi:predicted adenine nucleotide alpha hydrolase (AANH) superfamily ATPase